MIYVFLVVLLFLLFFVSKFYRNDLINPSTLMLSGFLISVLLALTRINAWGDLSVFGVFCLLVGVVSFVLGGIFGNSFAISYSPYREIKRTKYYFRVHPFFVVISAIFMTMVAVQNFRYTLSAARYAGYTGGITAILSFARSVMSENSMSPFLNVSIMISQALTYVFAFDLIFKLVNKIRNKSFFLEIICQILFLLISVLSTGRTMFLHYLIYIFVVFCILLSSKKKRGSNRTIISVGIVVVVLALSAFWIVDATLRASRYGTEWGMWYQITKYTSSSLFAFDYYVSSPTFASDGNYETLYNLFSILNRFGFAFESNTIALESVPMADLSTNVFTAFRRYIHDFGYFGLVVVPMLIGFIFHYSYRRIKNGNASAFQIIAFCTFIYSVVFMCIEERFLINVLSLRSLVIAIAMFLVLKFLDLNSPKPRITTRAFSDVHNSNR